MNESRLSHAAGLPGSTLPGAHLIAGSDGMADAFREKDWSKTALGPIETWPETLLVSVNLLLLSPLPSTLFWGDKFILLYNEAYRAFLGGKHPAALGRPAELSWQEVWPTVGPALSEAFDRGIPVNFKNRCVPIEIDGEMQDRYWTFCFYPVYDRGRIVGVAETSIDSTEEVLAARRLHESQEEASRVLQSIGDGVIVTDAETRIVRMNAVAQALTGWDFQAASGRELAEVFQIVNETTRAKVESPAEKVRRLGTVVGLANHTILIGRDGRETPIDDSGAPVRDDAGHMTGIVLVFRDIADRRLTERLREGHARRMQEVLDVSADGVAKLDRDWTISFLNEKARQMLAASGDVLGKNHWASFPSAVFEDSPWLKHYFAAMEEGIPGEFDHYYPEPLNIWMHITVRAISDGIVVYFRDTTEERRAAAAMATSEERLRMALSAANGVGIWDWDVQLNLVYADASFARMYGVDAEAGVRGIAIEQFTANMHPDDRDRVESEITEAVRSRCEFSSEYRLVQKDGSVRWVAAVGRCNYAPDGSPLRFPGVTVDITARKAIEQALRKSEAHYNAIYSNSHEYIGILSPDGRIIDTNRASLSFDDTDPREIANTNFADGPWFRYSPGVPGLIQRAIERSAAGESVREELTLYRRSGETCTFDFSLTPVRNDEGEVLFLVPEARDVTEVRMRDDALRASEERLRIAADTAQLGIWQIDIASRTLECSDICKGNYGRSPADPFSFEDVLAALHPEDLPEVMHLLQQAIASKGTLTAEYRVLWPDGSAHWIVANGRVIAAEDGMPSHMVGVSMDVTERRLSEAALLQTEKLAAVGRLAASIAHEINNPLESVTNLLYLARESDNLPDAQKYLDSAERELRRVSVISSQTLRFHKQSTRPRAVPAEELIDSVLSIHQGRIVNSRVTIEKRMRADKPIACFEGEIRQVLNNLIGNAIDAMQHTGGRLLLRSRAATHWPSGRHGLLMTIADSGTGINPQTVKKIFDPFFTTKGIGGTGLGLWVSQEIMERHQGVIRIRSSEKEGVSGTVFSVFLPSEPAPR